MQWRQPLVALGRAGPGQSMPVPPAVCTHRPVLLLLVQAGRRPEGAEIPFAAGRAQRAAQVGAGACMAWEEAAWMRSTRRLSCTRAWLACAHGIIGLLGL